MEIKLSIFSTRNLIYFSSDFLRRFNFSKLGIKFGETLNFFKSTSPPQTSTPAELPAVTTTKEMTTFRDSRPNGSIKSQKSISGDHESLNSNDEKLIESATRLPKEDLYKWMARQQEYNLQGKPSVTFDKVINNYYYFAFFDLHIIKDAKRRL